MIRPRLTFYSILILLFVFLLRNLSYSSEALNAVPKEVYDEICQDVINEEIQITCDVNPSMLSWIDLNSDGTNEIIVDGNGISVFYEGAAGYTSFLFQLKNNKYILVNDFFGWNIKISGTKTNGYFDLIQEYKDYYGPNDEKTGWFINRKFYLFNKAKEKYVLSYGSADDKEMKDYLLQYKNLSEQKQDK